jgi:hypothetical protein
MQRIWCCIAVGDDRQYGGNTGYDDELTSKYSYDSNVANHRQLSKGDLIVLRNKDRALGLARIEEIVSGAGTKLMRRCPTCNTTNIKQRVTKVPQWRCVKGHEFEEALQVDEAVTKYEARFGTTFIRIEPSISAVQLKNIASRPNDQASMEELERGGLERLLGDANRESVTMLLADTSRQSRDTQHT